MLLVVLERNDESLSGRIPTNHWTHLKVYFLDVLLFHQSRPHKSCTPWPWSTGYIRSHASWNTWSRSGGHFIVHPLIISSGTANLNLVIYDSINGYLFFRKFRQRWDLRDKDRKSLSVIVGIIQFFSSKSYIPRYKRNLLVCNCIQLPVTAECSLRGPMLDEGEIRWNQPREWK